ncbi:hypothetical protein [Kordia sp.]|uniref:hypothetical protein n=1 Tax=Kordia sp. TaxID=1965332 RepID=UPI003D6C00C9
MSQQNISTSLKNLTSQKIDGRDIDRFDYMVFINAEKTLPNASKLRQFYIRQKISFRVGNYRIVKKNRSYIEVNFKRTRFPDCLNGCIKKLKFAARKYEGY